MQALSSKLDHFVDQQLLEFVNDFFLRPVKICPCSDPDGQADRESERQTDGRTDIETNRQRERQTGRL